MKHTEHYQLNQWEANDKVQRTDFNADNTKLDGALHRLAQEKAERSKVEALQSALAGVPYVKIKELTVSTPAQTVDLNVSDVDFTRFLKWNFSFPVQAVRTGSMSRSII